MGQTENARFVPHDGERSGGGPARVGPPQPPDTLLLVSELFSVRLTVREYEVDKQGHLNWAEYLHYAEHARWSCLAAAGVSQGKLIASGFARQLSDDPGAHLRELATNAALLGLA
jgi:hypothetical protein